MTFFSVQYSFLFGPPVYPEAAFYGHISFANPIWTTGCWVKLAHEYRISCSLRDMLAGGRILICQLKPTSVQATGAEFTKVDVLRIVATRTSSVDEIGMLIWFLILGFWYWQKYVNLLIMD